MTDSLRLRVSDIVEEHDVRTLALVDPAGGLLPAFVPGSHLVVGCGPRTNAYSLLDDGRAADAYRISVLRRADGEGGSRWLHDEVRIGQLVDVSLPRSAFAPISRARRHLLVAAGIGITPLLSHARAAVAWDRDVTLLYRYRPGRGAHLAELRELCGPALVELTDRSSFTGALDVALESQPIGTHLYVCGPGPFTDDVLAAAAAAGWPTGRVHTERFSAAVLDPGKPFEVRLRDRRAFTVPAGVSLLDALEEQGLLVPRRCRQGVCGECRVDVAAGTLEHRDLYLSEAERAANDSVMACVSRARGRLELAL